MSAEPIVVAGENPETLRAEIDQLKKALDEERSRGFLRRFVGLGPRTAEETEKTRERMRGRLALLLVAALIVVVGLTFVYLLILSRGFGDLTTDDLIALIPMVGTTLLTPLIGLIGAVMGFYYGGQTAVSAATQTAEATKAASTTAANNAANTAANVAAKTAAQMSNGTTNGTN
jgi:hypothetical protein